MNSKGKENNAVSLKAIYRIPGIVIAIVAIISPFAIGTESSLIYYHLAIVAMTWYWDNGIPTVRGGIFRFSTPLECILTLPYTFLRFYFAYQLDRYYKHEIDKKTIYKWIYVSELPLLIIGLLVIVQVAIYSIVTDLAISGFQIFIPFPIVLLLGVLIIHFIPTPIPASIWME